MGKKIAQEDRQVMDGLFASEYGKLATAAGIKTAVAKTEISDDNGKEQGPQAFKDHEEYVDVVTSVMNDDKSESFDPNDLHKD
ncbi:Uncharacterised protein [uncultured archaeon]|nr:Uncharacterised protein [uncultured archaeon]